MSLIVDLSRTLWSLTPWGRAALLSDEQVVSAALAHLRGQTAGNEETRGPAPGPSMPLWERAVLLGGGALAAAVIPIAVLALTGGDGETPPPASLGEPESVVRGLAPTATPAFVPNDRPVRAIAVGSRREAPPDATSTPPACPADEQGGPVADQAGVPGTSLVVDEECPPAADETLTPGGPATWPTVPPPSTAPTPEHALSATEAVALAAQWIDGNPHVHYTVVADSCAATAHDAHWSVICSVTRDGCAGTTCRLAVTICIFEQPVLIDWC